MTNALCECRDRLAGCLHARGRRVSEARSELLAGLEVAEREDDRYEQALLLRELVALAGHGTLEERPDGAVRAAEILDSMGVALRATPQPG